MKKRIISLFAVFSLLLAFPAQAADGKTAIDRAKNGVARVLCVYQFRGDSEIAQALTARGMKAYSLGSSFGVGKAGEPTDIFITNAHVVAPKIYNHEITGEDLIIKYGLNADRDTTYLMDLTLVEVWLLMTDNSFSTVSGVDTSRSVRCKVSYRAEDNEPDLAVLKAERTVEERVALPLAQSEETLGSGTPVYALGYPSSADAVNLVLYENDADIFYGGSVESCTALDGTVGRLVDSELEGYRIVQHSAGINPGNSGGPLVTEDGRVIGINVSTFNMEGINNPASTNHSSAIESEYLIELLDQRHIDYDLSSPDNAGEADSNGEAEKQDIHSVPENNPGDISTDHTGEPVKQTENTVSAEDTPKDVEHQKEDDSSEPDSFKGILPYVIAAVAVTAMIIMLVMMFLRKKDGHKTEAGPAPVQPIQPMPPAPPVQSAPQKRAVLRSLNPQHGGMQIVVSAQPLIIGRSRNCALIYSSDSPGVSRHHCTVAWDASTGTFSLTDLHSSYGTTLANGQKVTPEQPAHLRPGEMFYVGDRANGVCVDVVDTY